jgi:MurNAc alpha-1-phosphate uridylyltransferase
MSPAIDPTPALPALILAAGRGERMRPLTDTLPKPLLPVHGKPLIEWHLEALARDGVGQVVINTAWLGHLIAERFSYRFLRDGETPMSIDYSHEGVDFGRALETAGGIARALPRLGDGFWLLAGDVFVPGFVFTPEATRRFAERGTLAHLWLVANPVHNPGGDFGLSPAGIVLDQAPQQYTYSTIGLYSRALFEPPWCDIAPGNPDGIGAPLAPLLRKAIAQGRVSGEIYRGRWTDVGTPERLAELNATPVPPA